MLEIIDHIDYESVKYSYYTTILFLNQDGKKK